MPLLTTYKVKAVVSLYVVDESGRTVTDLTTTGKSEGTSAKGLTESAADALSEAHARLTEMTDAYRAADTDKALRADQHSSRLVETRRLTGQSVRDALRGKPRDGSSGPTEEQADMALRVARNKTTGAALGNRITDADRSRFGSVPTSEIPWDVTP